MNLADLLAGYRSGFSLPQGFYVRPDIFDRDMALLSARWICVGHASEIPRAGDYMVRELGRESAIVVRGEDGVVRALANVCRHRGSRICTVAEGHAMLLVCPYHAWSYRLDGELRQARQMGEGFDPGSHGLGVLPIAIVGGLVFISFGDVPPSLDAAAAVLGRMTGRFGWDAARVAARRCYPVAANWKLAVENYHECYHCGPAHPEFTALHALARVGEREIGDADVEQWEERSGEVARLLHSRMGGDAVTGSRDGKAVARLMGEAVLYGNCVFAEVGMLSAFLAYADHGVIYRFIPRDVGQTDIEVTWLVHRDAVDYDVEALTWLWDVTSVADKRIIENNQAGVASRAYRPGPFSLMEPATGQFVDHYIGELRAGATSA